MTYNQAQLQTAFDAVADGAHWKNQICSEVDISQIDITYEAIVYFTATVPHFSKDKVGGKWFVTALGYSMGPAGDH